MESKANNASRNSEEKENEHEKLSSPSSSTNRSVAKTTIYSPFVPSKISRVRTRQQSMANSAHQSTKSNSEAQTVSDLSIFRRGVVVTPAAIRNSQGEVDPKSGGEMYRKVIGKGKKTQRAAVADNDTEEARMDLPSGSMGSKDALSITDLRRRKARRREEQQAHQKSTVKEEISPEPTKNEDDSDQPLDTNLSVSNTPMDVVPGEIEEKSDLSNAIVSPSCAVGIISSNDELSISGKEMNDYGENIVTTNPKKEKASFQSLVRTRRGTQRSEIGNVDTVKQPQSAVSFDQSEDTQDHLQNRDFLNIKASNEKLNEQQDMKSLLPGDEHPIMVENISANNLSPTVADSTQRFVANVENINPKNDDAETTLVANNNTVPNFKPSAPSGESHDQFNSVPNPPPESPKVSESDGTFVTSGLNSGSLPSQQSLVSTSSLVTDNTHYVPFAVNVLLVGRKPPSSQGSATSGAKITQMAAKTVVIKSPADPSTNTTTVLVREKTKEKPPRNPLQSIASEFKGKKKSILGNFDFNIPLNLTERERRFNNTDTLASTVNPTRQEVEKKSANESTLRTIQAPDKQNEKQEDDNANDSLTTRPIIQSNVCVEESEPLGESAAISTHHQDDQTTFNVPTSPITTSNNNDDYVGNNDERSLIADKDNNDSETDNANEGDKMEIGICSDEEKHEKVKKPYSAAATYPPLPLLLCRAASLIPAKPKRLLPASATSTSAAPAALSKHLVIEMSSSNSNLLDKKEMGIYFNNNSGISSSVTVTNASGGLSTAPTSTASSNRGTMFSMPINTAHRTVAVPADIVATSLSCGGTLGAHNRTLLEAILLKDDYRSPASSTSTSSTATAAAGEGSVTTTAGGVPAAATPVTIPYCYCARFMGLVQRSAATGLVPIPSTLKPAQSQLVLLEHAFEYVKRGEGVLSQGDGRR